MSSANCPRSGPRAPQLDMIINFATETPRSSGNVDLLSETSKKVKQCDLLLPRHGGNRFSGMLTTKRNISYIGHNLRGHNPCNYCSSFGQNHSQIKH